MKNVWILLSIILAFLLIGVFIFGLQQKNTRPYQIVPSAHTPSPRPSTPAVTSEEVDNMVVYTPKEQESVRLPIRITGKARVFENQFNYRVRDLNRNIILESSAYANSPDTGEFGNFNITITSLPTMRANGIILEVFDYSAKDGTEENTVTIPVIFDTTDSVPVKVYFGRKDAPKGEECTSVYPIEHRIMKNPSIAKAAVEELLKGPLISETTNGYYTSLNEGISVQKLTIVDGIARVDFDKRLEENQGGSCRVVAIRTQIIQTLKQFPTVKEVIISIDGRTEDILQP